jgi:hypothetical protein
MYRAMEMNLHTWPRAGRKLDMSSLPIPELLNWGRINFGSSGYRVGGFADIL